MNRLLLKPWALDPKSGCRARREGMSGMSGHARNLGRLGERLGYPDAESTILTPKTAPIESLRPNIFTRIPDCRDVREYEGLTDSPSSFSGTHSERKEVTP